MNKKIIILIIAVLVLVFSVYQVFFKKEKPKFTVVEVVRGTITQEVSETGQIQKGDKINVSFKNPGRIESISAKVGDQVKKGDILAKLDASDLRIQLQEARANFTLNQAQLNKLLVGATAEQIKSAQTAVSNAENAFQNAQQNLKDVTAQAEESLNSSYEDALNTLNDTYLKAYNAQSGAALIQRTYFTGNDQQSTVVKEKRSAIETSVSKIKSYLDAVQASSSGDNVDLNLSQIKNELSNVSGYLKIIRENCEEPGYSSLVSSTDKSSLDTHRSNINTAITNVANAQQTIASTKLANEYNVNTAKTSASSTEGSLLVAKDSLNTLIAPPRQEDVELYQAQVDKAQAEVQILENKIQEAYLKSPVDGQIIEIKKRTGELVQSALSDAVIILLPTDTYEIEADIYEEDVVKMNIGNEVDISLIAFPEQTFKGKVVSVDPAEKLVEGVVYYKTIIDFEQIPEGVKPGMTADLVIKTASKENVLIIPRGAINKKDGKIIVEVLKGKNIEEREVQIGLEGNNDAVEIVSGLIEREKVIIR
jgi:RND family efflux transporter MFP subunit